MNDILQNGGVRVGLRLHAEVPCLLEEGLGLGSEDRWRGRLDVRVAVDALDDEPDVFPAAADGIPLLTRTPPAGGLTLHHADAGLERHALGFCQPVADAPEVAADDVDLVVVGARGHGRVGSALLGSVSTWLLQPSWPGTSENGAASGLAAASAAMLRSAVPAFVSVSV